MSFFIEINLIIWYNKSTKEKASQNHSRLRELELLARQRINP
ncbi:hypothetical protein HMPREF9093_00632 [Fusobacterium sp. oral taxon 370 str. F0437]|nr:hypothetical protein HMPREF9093_00632 [Fusobacterium sp. oral taxon 370 str. F0437]